MQFYTSDIPEKNNDNSEPWTTSVSTEDTKNENLGVTGMEREEFESVIGKLNEEISYLDPPPHPHAISSTNQEVNHNTTSSSKAPPHCTTCHHPLMGHKRSRRNFHVTCNFCPQSTCTVTSSSFLCACAWNRENKSQSRQQQAPQPKPTTHSLTVKVNNHGDVTEWILPMQCMHHNCHVNSTPPPSLNSSTS